MSEQVVKGMWETKSPTCQCHIEGLRLVYNQEDENQPWLDEFYVSLWSDNKFGAKPTLRYRLRHIWAIIRKGHPWEDEIILTPEAAARAAEFFLNPTGK